ncbi:hypothetical protein EMIT051CA3_11153 [Pseudomonas chlororaphis]
MGFIDLQENKPLLPGFHGSGQASTSWSHKGTGTGNE